MSLINNKWAMCQACQGNGKQHRLIEKQGAAPKYHLENCPQCQGKGIEVAVQFPQVNNHYPHLAIIGGGIGGVALAVACLHRGIPFTIFERDESFSARSQGYGLTLQQASKVMAGLGVLSLPQGVVSTKHVVFNTQGKIVGEWGLRTWLANNPHAVPRKSNIHNIHIARQNLRQSLIHQLGDDKTIHWGYQLTEIKQLPSQQLALNFLHKGKPKQIIADLVIGADGIRSSVRKSIIPDTITPLRYLDCMVILGICAIDELKPLNVSLFDSATVFQTANGHERIYVMPYTEQTVMWQLSFPIAENKAKELSQLGPQALKDYACKIAPWHTPIPQLLAATPPSLISGYPVYDRTLLEAEFLKNAGAITLIGDAAHPMSPFKGQGANQALLDALALAKTITAYCQSNNSKQPDYLRQQVLTHFEAEMMKRSAVKVMESRAAAKFLHSDIVLQEGNLTRGGFAKSLGKW